MRFGLFPIHFIKQRQHWIKLEPEFQIKIQIKIQTNPTGLIPFKPIEGIFHQQRASMIIRSSPLTQSTAVASHRIRRMAPDGSSLEFWIASFLEIRLNPINPERKTTPMNITTKVNRVDEAIKRLVNLNACLNGGHNSRWRGPTPREHHPSLSAISPLQRVVYGPALPDVGPNNWPPFPIFHFLKNKQGNPRNRAWASGR